MTSDDLEQPKCILVEKSFYGAHQKNPNEGTHMLAGRCLTLTIFFARTRKVAAAV